METMFDPIPMNLPRWRLWLLAARPKTLTATFVPVLLGQMLAYLSVFSFRWGIAALCLFSSLLIQVGANLLNDAFDFHRGADTKDRIGFPRVTQMGVFTFSQVVIGALLCFFIALLLALPLMWEGGALITFLFFLSVAGAYLYTGGPYPFAYNGMGEVSIFFFFGLVNVFVADYVLTHHFHLLPLFAGIQIGSLATALVMVNNLRDIHTDVTSHKRTCAIFLGVQKSRWLITVLLFFPFALNIYWVGVGFPFVALLTAAAIPLALMISLSIHRTDPSPLYNRIFSQTALLHFLFGLLMAIGLFLS